ncbi:zinc finger protein 62 homolog isoform X1 [Diorhabda sublineata]|uniref:zinc finger protein 62 homolog isoform X1 n=1 Tax=Diorhabda sublineata TaxID=1163346 RepID=UPI0024E15251|nr:zinc finger protein 62 homolog isoform X1 [Diorhabda sublineata]
MAEGEIVDFQSCCRLCLTEIVESIKSIFDETVEDRRLSEKIQQSVAIEINCSDKLSTKVCDPCIEKVVGWYSFKEQCLKNQKKLEDWINSKNPDGSSELTPEQTSTPQSEVTPEVNSSHSSTSISNVAIQIKEEPQDHIEEPQVDDHQEDIFNNLSDTVDSQLDQQNDIHNDIQPELMHHNHVLVKSEPLDMDGLEEPMEEEYNEFPPNLSPQHLENGENLQEPLVVRTTAFNRTCSVCGKLFSNAGNKKKHERMQHGLHNNISIATPILNGLTNGDVQHGSPIQTEQQKILNSMSLKVLKTIPIETPENLTKIENSYVEKCKAMVSMHKTLICACHNVPHQNLKGLLSHLRALRIWFPVFTCYNCMITFTDRSTFTRHISRCQSAPLDTITKLSELRIRTEVKTRLYQNFKCTICKFMFSFHEDFCKHVDEDHAMLQFPVHCPCGKTCENEEEYKDHVYVSCLVEFYCDICFVTTKTLDDFQKHAAGVHDDSEGFILLQDDNYKVRKPSMHVSPTGVDEGAIIQGKRERKASFKTPLYDDDLDEILPTSLASATYYTPKTTNRVCPICYKEYSSYKNMMRHYKTHKPEEIQNHQQQQQMEQGYSEFQDYQDQSQESQDMELEEEESFYSCPDCGGMYSTMEWKVHLTEKHPSKPCGECGKFFQFQTELDQHRSVHLNLKVYRDSKTQSYKSTMLSPGGEGEGEGEEMVGCEMCDLVFTSKEDLMTHQLEQGHAGITAVEVPEPEPEVTAAPKKYRCDICEQEFNNYNGLWEHNRTRHPERKTPHADTYPKQCKDCNKVCTTGAAYYRHRQIHEKVPADAAASKATLLKPKKFEEPEEESYHTCKRCFKVFSSKYNLKNHLKCHGININPISKKLVRKAVCKVCQNVFETNEELIRHKQEAHNGVETPDDMDMASLVFPCDTCVMTFTSKAALKKHKEKHTLEYKSLHRQVYCKYCKISFENFQSLTQHMQLEHNEKVKMPPIPKPNDFTCSICQKSFQSSGALTTHIGWHKRALNDSSSKLLKHAPPSLPPPPVQLPRMHQVNIKEEPMDDVTKYQCDTCLAELPNDTALQVHILEKHRSVSAIMLIPRCNTCNKDFSTQDEYETHKRLHDFLERQKQHEQKMLVQQQEMPSQRMSPANKQKSFPCKHCNAAFSRSDTLGAHIRQFHKEHVQTEFKCNQCDRVFEKQNSLTIHLKVHEKQRAVPSPVGKPLFSCSICNMGFDLPKDLRAHTITAHPF